MKKTKISLFLKPEIAKAIRIQAARLGVSKSECVRLFLFEPKRAEKMQRND